MTSGSQALDVVQTIYGAFGRGDLPTILGLIADEVDWRFHGPAGVAFTRRCRSRDEVAQWFAAVAQNDDVQAFEPRELIDAGEHVTVLGWERTRALPGGVTFETEWVHVWTVRSGRVTRFWGMYDTEAGAVGRR